jgi:hypothetical protein
MKKEKAVKVTKVWRDEEVSPNKELLFKRAGGRDRRPRSGPDPGFHPGKNSPGIV